MGARSVAAGAASLNIIGNLADKLRVVREMAERQIATVAKQSAIEPRRVAMIDVEPPAAIVSSAKVARLRLNDRDGLIVGQSVPANDSGHMLLVRSRSVATAIPGASLVSMLGSVVAHPLVFAFAASCLANAARHIVETIVADWARFTTPAARFFHSVSRSRLEHFRRAEALL